MEHSSEFILKGKTADVELLDLFGATSIAYKTNIDGQVCFMKKLRPELRNDKRCRDLFYKEYNTGKKISSPYIVKYIDIKDDAHGLCIIMEYVNGCTLKEKIEKEPEYFKQKENIKRLLLQLCEALHTLHNENVVYLDINPCNIMISQTSNNIKLVDLGFCLSDWNDMTAGATSRFGAPEASKSCTGEIDARSDIYSIGCLLQYIQEKTGTELPGYIKRIAKHCLQQEKKQRYANVNEIIRIIKHQKSRTIAKATAITLFAAALIAGFIASGLHTTISNYIGWQCGKYPTKFEADGVFYNITDHAARTVEVTFKGNHPDEFEYEYTGNEVNIPQNITYYGRVFSVTSIAGDAFKNPYISKVNIPDGIVTIEQNAFNHCNLNGIIHVPNSVKHIGKTAFYPILYIEGFDVDDNNTVYDSRDNCQALIETVTNTLLAGGSKSTIPNTITSIAEKAFTGTQAKKITIPESVTSIGKAAFVHSELEEVHLPDNITILEEYLFQRSEKLRHITLPKKLKEIHLAALSHCGFTELIIPNSVTTIGDYAFDYCERLEKVVIGESVESIGDYAFDGCKWLTKVVSHIPADRLFEISGNVFGNINDNCVLYVPKGAKRAYEKTFGWNCFAKIVEMDGL